MRYIALWVFFLFSPAAAQSDAKAPTPVNVHNFVRAETDLYFRKTAIDDGAFSNDNVAGP